MQATISVDGQAADRQSLHEWLGREQDLRGHVRLAGGSPVPGSMSATGDLILQVVATAAGASAVWAALANSLSVWLTQRRSDVTVTITGDNGRTVTVDAKRVQDVAALMRSLTENGLDEQQAIERRPAHRRDGKR